MTEWKPEFIVMAPPYDDRSGGSIVLHHLCHLINEGGGKSALVPLVKNRLVSSLGRPINLADCLSMLWASLKGRRKRSFKLNPNLNTPVLYDVSHIAKRHNVVVVYPEIIAGNPLNARHVARWLLHEPGFHTGNIFFCRGEVQFAFSDRFSPVRAAGLEIAPFLLDIFVVPWVTYKAEPHQLRKGTAYAIRKGKGKAMVHDLANSTLIDGLAPAKVGQVFSRVETFISYDPHTMYSAFAVMAGCESVVIPDPGIPEEVWCPNEVGRAGIAYGFVDLERARGTRDVLLKQLKMRDVSNAASVGEFVDFWRQRIQGN